MFLSKLVVNIGEDPTRYRPARQWLRNLYRVHQRLWMAFPDGGEPARENGPPYPYFPDRLAHGPALDTHLLFRLETSRPPVILVQSALQPDWRRAFWNAEYLLREHPPSVREYELPTFDHHSVLRFRLAANPTKRLRRDSRNAKGEPIDEKWIGKRVALSAEHLENWLTRRAARCGFRVGSINNLQAGYVYVNRTRDSAKGQRLRSVRYDGVLEITDPDRFRETLIHGIGPAKAFGFGLLSVAPVSA